MSINKLRSLLYSICRFLGDVNAVQRGPTAIARRLARKAVGRWMGRIITRI